MTQEDTPLYIGSFDDFLKLFSTSICTNTVQVLTKKYKRDKGCQYRKLINNGQLLSGLCNGEIEATHVKGVERKDTIRYIVWCLANNK